MATGIDPIIAAAPAIAQQNLLRGQPRGGALGDRALPKPEARSAEVFT